MPSACLGTFWQRCCCPSAYSGRGFGFGSLIERFPSARAGPRCRGGRRGRASCRSWPVQMPESFPSTVSHRPFSSGRHSPSPYPNSNPPRSPEAPATAPTRIRRRPTWRRRGARAPRTTRQSSSSSSSLSLPSDRSELGSLRSVSFFAELLHQTSNMFHGRRHLLLNALAESGRIFLAMLIVAAYDVVEALHHRPFCEKISAPSLAGQVPLPPRVEHQQGPQDLLMILRARDMLGDEPGRRTRIEESDASDLLRI